MKITNKDGKSWVTFDDGLQIHISNAELEDVKTHAGNKIVLKVKK